eukprot:CAMPEP_0181133710 /NCGR_PEP_ID=MMETSP1071-20121207/31671_1 /TAXON_ID=35127 /ORGANISM="Thalassiosira sp., Strain NH16" /LENGTH=575 /DNA_ID=CAMNT_0023220123 /DNA_START=261 /DNA_END=1988 /DNA_ORIENTATION=+
MQSGYGAVPVSVSGNGGVEDHSVNACQTQTNNELHRHLSLFDLVCVGVGATVGSGVFVLIGLISHTQAGPAVSVSWLVAGVAACASGLCYAELGGRFPSVGSSYVYAKETMGECAAVVAGACLTLEYTGSASAVARSWGDKVVSFAQTWEDEAVESAWYRFMMVMIDPGFGINPCAFLISTGSVLLLLDGVKESKSATNFFSTVNVSLVFFMATMSLILAKSENMSPFIPPEFGEAGGVIRGATSSFFGYIGFDEICCISGEAIDPTRNVPRAIIITLIVVTSLYCASSIGLAGMVPYEDISGTSGFPDGFRYRGYNWAADITAFGELAVLPIVVLVTIMAQPRLNYTMALDGVLPEVFAKVDDDGNLRSGTKIAGAIMVIIATVVPFAYLDDLISSGILIAFTMTDTSVILVRKTSPPDKPFMLEMLLAIFHILSLLSGFLLRSCLSIGATGNAIRALTLLSSTCTVLIGNRIRTHCPSKMQWHSNEPNSVLFLTPFVPTLPLFGCFVNLYLISQLEVTGLCAIFGFVGVALLLYFYSLHRKKQHAGLFANVMPADNGIRTEHPERMLSMPEAK